MSEYLSEEEQLARMKSWWDVNGTWLMLAIVAAVVVIGGWSWYSNYQQNRSHAASKIYATFQAAEGDEKNTAAASIAEQYAGTAYHIFVLFQQAQASFSDGDLAAAETLLGEAVGVADDKLLVDLAKVRLAKVQNALDRSSEAFKTLESLSNEGYRAWGLEAKGDIHMSKGEVEQAHAAYEAAFATVKEGEQRPILEMKLNNAAPFDGQYVQIQDTLGDALNQAQTALESVEEAVNAVGLDLEEQIDTADAGGEEPSADSGKEPSADSGKEPSADSSEDSAGSNEDSTDLPKEPEDD